MAIYRNAQVLMAAALMLAVSMHARAQTGQTTFPKVASTMSKDQFKPHVGLIAGLNSPEVFRSSMEYGLDLGYQPWTPLGLGLEWSGANTSRDFNDGSEKLSRTNLLLKAVYNLGGTAPVIRYSYLGLGLGAVIDANAYKGTHSGIAPLAGFDIPLTNDAANFFSLGLSAKYVFVSGPSPDAFSMNGAVKYWF